MKKFLAMLLAAMMLLSSVGALAAIDPHENGAVISFDVDTGTDNSELEVENDYTSRYKKEDWKQTDAANSTVKTELWMQVDASGQIDVTVPLVLVFSTNIDGGKAQEAANYVIYNNNTRNSVAVDKIEVTNGADNTQMTLQSKTTFNNEKNLGTGDDKRNYYYVVFEPEKNTSDTSASSANGIGIAMDTKIHSGTQDTTDGPIYYDLYNATTANPVGKTHYNTTDSTAVALMTIGQGGSINLKPTMETTPLNFVTANFMEDAQQFAHGVHLLNVTYTVGLQYMDAQGRDIQTMDQLNGQNVTTP